jgi:hypothetical protein
MLYGRSVVCGSLAGRGGGEGNIEVGPMTGEVWVGAAGSGRGEA